MTRSNLESLEAVFGFIAGHAPECGNRDAFTRIFSYHMKDLVLKSFCALLFLVLTASPYTAPFQTCNESAASSVSVVEETDPGSVVAPLVTERGQLTLALPTVVLTLLPFDNTGILAGPIPLTYQPHHDSTSQTVLRL